MAHKPLDVLRRTIAIGTLGLALPLLSWADTAPKVKFVTSMGEFVVELNPQKAPKTVDNFLQYVKSKHYDGTVFHRVIKNFMVQGGGYTVSGNERPTRPPIALEAQNGLRNDVGTIAMARTQDPHSASAQFYVNVKNNDFLNARGPSDGYTVFGKVVSGMDVIHKIKLVPTGAGDVPTSPVIINSATQIQ